VTEYFVPVGSVSLYISLPASDSLHYIHNFLYSFNFFQFHWDLCTKVLKMKIIMLILQILTEVQVVAKTTTNTNRSTR